MCESVGDDPRMLTLGDEDDNLEGAERVGVEVVLQPGGCEGRLPDATHPYRPANGPSLRCREDPGLRSRPIESGEVFHELFGDRSGEYDGSHALCPLQWADDDAAPSIGAADWGWARSSTRPNNASTYALPNWMVPQLDMHVTWGRGDDDLQGLDRRTRPAVEQPQRRGACIKDRAAFP